ncbi:small s protein [Exophiala viscosa]|uniref:Small s protein n=1 Tax=Exophiala viscosa TaxID=2486360 RepID=A0AAN6DP68_9EURO|nr:small s protein [Exophiala viscosa]KAI1620829.1 small s protein [Exophiala viscosa]
MTEGVGLALALPSAFNNAVQYFQIATLKLDISKLRLSRWGRSVGLHEVEEHAQVVPTLAGSRKDHQKAKELLYDIVDLFENAERTSSKLKPLTKEPDVHTAGDLDETWASLHRQLVTISQKWLKPRQILEKAKWALYKGKHLNKLIQDITELVNGLVELFPAARPEQRLLCEQDGSELASDENVSLVAPLIAELDPELSAFIKSRDPGGQQNFHITVAGSTNHGLQQGYFSGQQTNHFGARS